MLKQSKEIIAQLQENSFDDLKLEDIASIASNMLNIPIPFSSLGFFHPLFFMSDLLAMP